jgi:hypothetical protein
MTSRCEEAAVKQSKWIQKKIPKIYSSIQETNSCGALIA